MLFSRSLLSLISFIPLALAQDDSGSKDLGTVLGGQKDLSKFYALIKKFPDVLLQLPSLDGVTIVAPSNKAFDNIPYTALNDVWNPDDKEVTVPLLQYHILQGSVSVNDIPIGPTVVQTTLLTSPKYTNVTRGQNVLISKGGDDTVIFTTSMGTRCTLQKGDIKFSGGLIQIVDNLLIPPAALSETSDAFHIESFLGGLYAADVMPELAERKNVTIFAPTNVAIAGVGTYLEGLNDEQLARIMNFHVIPNQVIVSSQLNNNTWLPTLTNQSALVLQDGNNKYINSAQIVQPDILIANGILHLISNVLNPDASAILPDPSLPTQPPLFPVGTVSGVFTSDLPCTEDCPITSTPDASSTSLDREAATSTDLFTSRSQDGASVPLATGHVAALIGFGAAGLAMW